MKKAQLSYNRSHCFYVVCWIGPPLYAHNLTFTKSIGNSVHTWTTPVQLMCTLASRHVRVFSKSLTNNCWFWHSYQISFKEKIQSLFSLYRNLGLAILVLEHPDISPKNRSNFGFHPIRAVVLPLAAFHWLNPFADNDSVSILGNLLSLSFE